VENFVAALLIALALVSAFYRPIKEDLKHAKTGEKPVPTWLDHVSEAVLDGIDRLASKIFAAYEKRQSKK
jgi:hypothetical protein